MTDPSGGPAVDPLADPRLDAALRAQGPVDAAVAQRLIARGRERLDMGDARQALVDFRRVVGHTDAAITSAALLGYGDALYRLDDERQAAAAWEAIVRLRDNPSTYQAWRNLAGVRVRAGELQSATEAYRQADRRAPAEDKAEIAARLGWLAKETGNAGAANRYFSRARGGTSISLAHLLVIVTSVVTLITLSDPEFRLFQLLYLDRQDVQNGDLWRLFTVTLVHQPGGPDAPWFSLHLLLNMYALWIVGPIVESIWGRRLLLLFYFLTAIAEDGDVAPHGATFEDGYRAAEVCDAIVRSGESGRREAIVYRTLSAH